MNAITERTIDAWDRLLANAGISEEERETILAAEVKERAEAARKAELRETVRP